MKTIVKIKGKIETQPSRGGRDKEENGTIISYSNFQRLEEKRRSYLLCFISAN